MMKVACVGNMNNMLFGLCRYLRDNGIDAHLFLHDNEFSHFLPQCDTYDFDFEEYTYQLSLGSISSWKHYKWEEDSDVFNSYNFIIATGPIGFFEKINRSIDVFFPSGTDLIHWPFIGDKQKWHQKIRNPHIYRFYDSHRRMIKNSSCINQEPYGDPWKKALIDLDVYEKTYYFGCPMIYHTTGHF